MMVVCDPSGRGHDRREIFDSILRAGLTAKWCTAPGFENRLGGKASEVGGPPHAGHCSEAFAMVFGCDEEFITTMNIAEIDLRLGVAWVLVG